MRYSRLAKGEIVERHLSASAISEINRKDKNFGRRKTERRKAIFTFVENERRSGVDRRGLVNAVWSNSCQWPSRLSKYRGDMFKNIEKIFLWLVLMLTIVGGLLFSARTAYPAEAVCFENWLKFEATVAVWAWHIDKFGQVDKEAGGYDYKKRWIDNDDQACFVVNNGEKMMIKFEIHRMRPQMNQLWRHIDFYDPGYYHVKISKNRLKITKYRSAK